MPPARKVLPFLLYPVLGLVAGWASVDGTRRGKASAAQRAEIHALETRQFPPVGGGRRTVATSSDHSVDGDGVIRLLQEHRRAAAEHEDPANLLRDWTDQQILAGLDEAVEHLRRPSSDVRPLLCLLFHTYANRDIAAALAWLGRQPQATIVDALSFTPIPLERGRDLLEFLMGRPELFRYEHSPFSQLESEVLMAAAEKGAEDLLPLVRKLLEVDPDNITVVTMEFPAGFGYARLLESLPRTDEAYYKREVRWCVVNAWLREDRDAAFHWLMENRDPGPNLGLLQPRSGEEAAWLVGKLEVQPAGRLTDFITLNARDLAASRTLLVEPALAAARTPAVRDALRDAFAQGVFFGNDRYVSRGLEALESLPDPAERLRMLETIEPRPEFRLTRVPVGHGRSMDVRSIHPPDEQAASLLRDTLSEWGAAGDRADAIISRIKRLTTP
jgi:hypothetical protein